MEGDVDVLPVLVPGEVGHLHTGGVLPVLLHSTHLGVLVSWPRILGRARSEELGFLLRGNLGEGRAQQRELSLQIVSQCNIV